MRPLRRPAIVVARSLASALAAAFALPLAGCSSPKFSVDLTLSGTHLYTCDRASTAELAPAGGGFRFVCESPEWQKVSLHLVNDTGPGSDGTLEYLKLTGPHSAEDMVAAHAMPGTDCAYAKKLARRTGQPPIPRNEKGQWHIAMAQPCGELELTVGAPR